jgi:hypothetical protein
VSGGIPIKSSQSRTQVKGYRITVLEKERREIEEGKKDAIIRTEKPAIISRK